ncbi:longicornsin-like isoform X1 [Dermacentor albipictus]|uniref:longicornsin-like isoform X1 n=1 Tax=Dermacentor albipictus TaxID=60249 RepID=UPI0031FC73FB
MDPRVLLCLVLFIAGSLAAEAEKAHSRSRRDFGCLMGNLMRCRLRCSRINPGTLGYCQGGRCMCETGIPVPGPAGIMRPRLVPQAGPIGPAFGLPVVASRA